MKNIKVVIGSNFGDEGKGLMTDYLSAGIENAIVVRFNGGAQAGHTIETPDGKRHVFGHFGAGSFTGKPTYLSEYFVVNPMTFEKEINSLNSLGVNPIVYVDKNCIVTTPFDMIINQAVEAFRGNLKHGSCGLGFNETITRSLEDEKFKITVNDLFNEQLLREKLAIIKEQYNMNRFYNLGVSSVPERYCSLLNNEGIIENYIYDINNMLDKIKVRDIGILQEFDNIIFEGAQGLMLDQGHEYFPYVTRSNTGIKNVVELINRIGFEKEDIEIIYVTRAYLTRHGVGTFPTETRNKPYEKIIDLTNVPNPYQGTLRFGILDIDLLGKTIRNDLKYAKSLNFNAKLAITCLDQINNEAKYITNSKEKISSIKQFITDTFNSVGFNEGYLSYGASRNTISNYEL
ncbi:MAG: adenylosuccinate synthase [Clostridiaceae bacterium]|jgi:adenylosuccinate synthase|nr:adenylosuccinate synthase [Clostridiaceae bacterium]